MGGKKINVELNSGHHPQSFVNFLINNKNWSHTATAIIY